MSLAVAITLVALAALLLSERRGSRSGVWLAKPLASTGFLLTALAAGALSNAYGRAVLVALALSWLGDVLLIPKQSRRAFLAGLASFLLGHVAYAVAFLLRGVDPEASAVATALVAVPSLTVLRWLWPFVPDRLRVPVVAYVGVISLMVACALGVAEFRAQTSIALGALAFYASDLAVARQRFVAESFTNKLWGLPLYYGAQLLLASTAGG
jgi:uncharacterized membrane protein YhhN